MRSHDIENWTLSIIDRAQSRQPIEDSRVELKARWPDDPKKAARRIAGHANAARCEPILWLIGVDEATGSVPGIDFTEFSSWYGAVKSSFDELAPEPISMNIPVNGVTVAALFFETERAPYVVKNSEGGSVQREVPWREATGIKSATRSQLLRLLSPLQKLPNIEVVGSLLSVSHWKSANGDKYLGWKARVALFLTQQMGQQTVIPSHRCSVTFIVPGNEHFGPFYWGKGFRGIRSENVNATDNAVTINGSGLFEVRCDISTKLEEMNPDLSASEASIEVTLKPANTELS